MANIFPVFTSITTAAPEFVSYRLEYPPVFILFIVFAKASSVTLCRFKSIVRTTSEPFTASFVVYSSCTVPSTLISNCFIPSSPFKYSSNVDSIQFFPIISSLSYVSFLVSSSLDVILPVYPTRCEAVVPCL